MFPAEAVRHAAAEGRRGAGRGGAGGGASASADVWETRLEARTDVPVSRDRETKASRPTCFFVCSCFSDVLKESRARVHSK